MDRSICLPANVIIRIKARKSPTGRRGKKKKWTETSYLEPIRKAAQYSCWFILASTADAWGFGAEDGRSYVPNDSLKMLLDSIPPVHQRPPTWTITRNRHSNAIKGVVCRLRHSFTQRFSGPGGGIFFCLIYVGNFPQN